MSSATYIHGTDHPEHFLSLALAAELEHTHRKAVPTSVVDRLTSALSVTYYPAALEHVHFTIGIRSNLPYHLTRCWGALYLGMRWNEHSFQVSGTLGWWVHQQDNPELADAIALIRHHLPETKDLLFPLTEEKREARGEEEESATQETD